ncbi:MAG TPA: hypothetical protein VJP02_03540 [Candidatus Sulfotelmatobacter sp.]|nr:hypothetical protein [Candidatus Sulfotelmatobacter sp.]
MPRIPIPTSTYTYPRGKPMLLIVLPVLGVMAFIGLTVRWTWVHGRLGWDGVLALAATVVVFAVIDYALLRYYERRGRALRTEPSVGKEPAVAPNVLPSYRDETVDG